MSEDMEGRQILCVAMPAILLAGAHWFPWKKVIGHDLRRLEAYAIGTAAIVGTATAAMLGSDGDGTDHATLLLTAAASAGIATLTVWGIDALRGNQLTE